MSDFYKGAGDLNSGPHAYLASALTHWAILLVLITGTFGEATKKRDFSGPSGFWAKNNNRYAWLWYVCPPSYWEIQMRKKEWEGKWDIAKEERERTVTKGGERLHRRGVERKMEKGRSILDSKCTSGFSLYMYVYVHVCWGSEVNIKHLHQSLSTLCSETQGSLPHLLSRLAALQLQRCSGLLFCNPRIIDTFVALSPGVYLSFEDQLGSSHLCGKHRSGKAISSGLPLDGF